MDKLHFLVAWEKDRERTWSGTCWGLYQALKQYYDIECQNVAPSEQRASFYRFFRIYRFFPGLNDLGLSNMLRHRRRLKNVLKEGTVFQFADICEDTEDLNTYVYKDMSLSYLLYMSENQPSLYRYSGVSKIPLSRLRKKEAEEKRYHQNCSGIFTMSTYLRDFLIEHDGITPEKVHHVGGGINVAQARIQAHLRRGNKILYTGRDYRRKGLRLVYDAFKILKVRMPHAELHVAGPSVDPVDDPINGYHYHGDVLANQLSDLLNQCDVFCMPSHFEAYGLVFPEALCYGLPCIGRNVQEMPHFIDAGKTGLLLEDNNPAHLADMMYEILTHSSYAENVRNRREEYLNQFSWQSVAHRIHDCIG